MKTRHSYFILIVLLVSLIGAAAIACPPPDCPACYSGSSCTVWDCDSDGYCCGYPGSQSCCNNSGLGCCVNGSVCLDAGENCCANAVCENACANVCCDAGQVACAGACWDGKCCNGTQCSSSDICCGSAGTMCCVSDCCGSQCCGAIGKSCCEGSSVNNCCATNEVCCDGSCCLESQCCDESGCVSTCPGSECCSDGTCVSECPDGECCDDGVCVSECPGAACCSDGACVEDCPTDECCDDDVCKSECPGTKCCSDGACVEDCPTGKCCFDDECATADTTPTSGDLSLTVVVPDGLVENIELALSPIVDVDLSEVVLNFSGEKYDCCKSDGTLDVDGVKCEQGELTLSTEIDSITIWGVNVEWQLFDNVFFKADVEITAAVTLDCTFSVTGTAGKRENSCDTDCYYGSVTGDFSISVGPEISISDCYKIGEGEDKCSSISFEPVQVEIKVGTGISMNGCDHCDDDLHGDACLDEIAVSASFKIADTIGLEYSHSIYEGDCQEE